jgi:D-beta-D-heptose 7-phosphate kinase/D-beta-D-heptose 1-phosphate adenosyltransferase
MPINFGYFSQDSNFKSRFYPDYSILQHQVEHLRGVGAKIVLTSGSFDLFHIGHALYLERAKQCGDILIVGVDDDEKIRNRKGEGRPVNPQSERVQILSHLRSVDIITLKYDEDPKWELIRIVRPEILVATEDNDTSEEIFELESFYCGKVVVMPRQAETSTSAKVRKMNLKNAKKLSKKRGE